jgi:gamma-glutamylcyclotransferase (GGCT)/AIG2-like uncharacterized protein YtfP
MRTEQHCRGRGLNTYQRPGSPIASKSRGTFDDLASAGSAQGERPYGASPPRLSLLLLVRLFVVYAIPPTAFLGLDADAWSALGHMLLGIGAVIGGGWAIYNYRQSRRYEAATWLQGVYKDFYRADTLTTVRQVLEYHYAETAGPLLSQRILDREVPTTDTEEVLLRELDTLLNYFEHVLYLEDEHRLSQKDRQAVFEYWFNLMKQPEYASLRRYAARFSFERVARVLGAHKEEYVAVYGSLLEGHGLPDRPEFGSGLSTEGRCLIPGLLFDLGGYPGLVPGDGTVRGELLRVHDLSVFRALDKYEKYEPRDRDRSLYLRKAVRLVEPAIDAWVYVYNCDVAAFPLISSGDWDAYAAKDEG